MTPTAPAVTFEQVVGALHPEEPDYDVAATLGPAALPFLARLVESGEPALASKAAYLAGLIGDPGAVAILDAAAASPDPGVRAAAAGGARYLTGAGTDSVLLALVDDESAGVRKAALRSVPENPSPALAARVDARRTIDPQPAVRSAAGAAFNRGAGRRNRSPLRVFTHDELEALARAHGVPAESADLAAAVAQAESGGIEVRGHPTLDPDVVIDSNARWSIGLWQVNSLNGPKPGEGRDEFTNDDLAVAAHNAEAMVAISSGGTDWTPWGAFTNGSYKKFLKKKPEEVLMALTAEEQKQLLATTMATNAEVGKLAVAIRDPTNGLGAQIAALRAELAEIRARLQD